MQKIYLRSVLKTFGFRAVLKIIACMANMIVAIADEPQISRNEPAAADPVETFSGFAELLPGPPSFIGHGPNEVAAMRLAPQSRFDSLPLRATTHLPIQQVSFDSTVTFLKARNSRTTPIATATDEASKPPEAKKDEVPLPDELPPVVVTPPESPTNNVTVPSVTLEMIAAQRTAAEQTPDLNDEDKAQMAKHFQRAIESITQKNEIDKKTAELKAEKENGASPIAENRAFLTQPPPKVEPEYPPGATVSELDQLRLAVDEKLAEARRNLELWEAKAKTRTERKPQMPALIETTRKQLEDEEKAIANAAPDGESPALGAARRLDQESHILLVRSQLELYRVESVRFEALNELFPLQRDVLTRIKNSLEKRAELWKTVVADARRDESARQANEAREKLRNAHPTLRDLAEDNASLTVRRQEFQVLLQKRVKELSETNATLSSIEKNSKMSRRKKNARV